MENTIKRIYDYSLEDIMGERFGRYSKTIIQNRALPDVRDGLKPVQRRILFAMYQDKNTCDKAYKKSAKTVGNVMGFYHPHGDSSIYEAMTRMSQWWKQNAIYIDMYGNNGSMDGDSPAAMRYTESRLEKISNELLTDINKDTVDMTYNYDDTLLEPIVLPAKYPNLLVNGCTGISAGYATNIPSHNLVEVIDATIKRIDSPNCSLETITNIIIGPDFQMGAIVEGKQGILDAYKTGRGRIMIRSKYTINKTQIIITEIPYDVNKANLVKKIDEIRIDKKIEGIIEVRDESDLENPETIVIDLKKDANSENIVNFLLKNTEMQISYNFNIVAIVNNRPETLGLLPIIDAYIEHFKEVLTRRTKFDLDHANNRMHILDGLIKAISILDEVVATIRASKDKADAKQNLVNKYDFTIIQAEAIVTLQLYRLTNTDITLLQEEQESLKILIKNLTEILENENVLKTTMKNELKVIKKEYGTPRKTEIKDEITEIKIDQTAMIPKEDCIVVITKEGYVKRVSKRSYQESDPTGLKDSDYLIGLYELNTLDTILLFTQKGKYLYVPVYEIPEMKWKELGKHISNIIPISNEQIIKSVPVTNFENGVYITAFSKSGAVKRTMLIDFKVTRYNKPMSFMKLKEDDKIIDINCNNSKTIFLTTEKGNALMYNTIEVSLTKTKGSGIKAIALKDDYLVSATVFDNTDYITVITENGTGKRIKVSEFSLTSRAKKGILLVREVKTNPYKIIKAIPNCKTLIINENEIKPLDLPIVDRHSTGYSFSKHKITTCYEKMTLEKRNIEIIKFEEKSSQINLQNIDKKLLTIDDYLDEIIID